MNRVGAVSVEPTQSVANTSSNPPLPNLLDEPRMDSNESEGNVHQDVALDKPEDDQTMPGQAAIPDNPSTPGESKEQPFYIAKDGIEQWYNYIISMRAYVFVVVVLVMIAFGMLLNIGFRKLTKKFKNKGGYSRMTY